jgi:hypothetical protein
MNYIDLYIVSAVLGNNLGSAEYKIKKESRLVAKKYECIDKNKTIPTYVDRRLSQAKRWGKFLARKKTALVCRQMCNL